MIEDVCDPVALLSALIAFDTSNLPGNERPCAEYLTKILLDSGFDTTIQPLPDNPNRANVIAVRGNPRGKRLLFNGHIDVVPVSDGWTSDPFTAAIRDGKLYGRGACDMKGGVAAMTAAALRLVKDGFDFDNGQLQLVFVCDEELHDSGIKHYVASPEFLPADYAIISEPTSLDCCVASRGVVRYELVVKGVSCHASMPGQGANAITMAGHAILALDRLAARLARRKHPILPPPTLAATIIEGGTKDNIIPNRVAVKMDRRTLPDESVESCRDEIAREMDALKAETPGFEYELAPYVSVAAAYLPENHELVGMCDRVHGKMFGGKIAVRDFGACNDQSFLIDAGIPTLVLGPGSIDQAHTVDEFVEVDELLRCTDYFYELAKEILR